MKPVHLLAILAAAMAGPGMAAAGPAEPPPGASSCTGCHAGRSGADRAVPPLAGRPPAEIVGNMQAFKSGSRAATVMDRIAKGFTDAEIEAIATWYAQQKPPPGEHGAGRLPGLDLRSPRAMAVFVSGFAGLQARSPLLKRARAVIGLTRPDGAFELGLRISPSGEAS